MGLCNIQHLNEISYQKVKIINLNRVLMIICRGTNETDGRTDGQLFTPHSGISSHSKGARISISWHRKVDPNGNIGFYAFDVGVISSILQNKVQISFLEEDKSDTVPLKSNNWTKCVKFPP